MYSAIILFSKEDYSSFLKVIIIIICREGDVFCQRSDGARVESGCKSSVVGQDHHHDHEEQIHEDHEDQIHEDHEGQIHENIMMIIHEDHIHHDDHNNQVDAVWSGMIIHDDHCDERKW